MEITKVIATSSNKKNVSYYNHLRFEVMRCFIPVPPVSRFASSLQVPVSLDHRVSYSRFSFPAKFPAVLENFLITFSSFLLSWQNTTQNNYGANKNNVNPFSPQITQRCKIINTDVDDLLHICLSKLKYHPPFMKKVWIVKIGRIEVKK